MHITVLSVGLHNWLSAFQSY